MNQQSTVKRLDFIRKFTMDAGLNYDQACRAYNSLIGVIEDAIVNGEKIKFGKVGALTVVRKPPRDVVMGFERGPKNVLTRTRRVFHLDERLEFRFVPYREFSRKHQLR